MDHAEDRRALRAVLSRHPVATEAAIAAGAAAGSLAEVVVFEAGRAFVVSSTGRDVLQPRHLTAAESSLLASPAEHAVVEGASSFAITDAAGGVAGAITVRSEILDRFVDVLASLARIVSAAASRAVARQDGQSIDAAILETLRDAVVVLDTDLNVRWANPAVGTLLGRTPADLVGRSGVELLHPDDVETAFDAITRLSQGLEIYRMFVRLERGGEGYERVEVMGTDQTQHPAVRGLVLSLRAAEVAEELEASVDRVLRMSDAIVTGLHDGIVATDEFGAVTMVNRAARDLFGLDPSVPPSRLGPTDFELLDERGHPISLVVPSAPAHDENGVERDVCVITGDDEFRYLTSQRRSVRDDDGRLLGSVFVFHDVTDARQAEDRLRSQALHDQLTGLANRRQLEQRLGEVGAEPTPTVVAACFIDLDGFKLVNDTRGHRIGDQLIRIAAKRLSGKIRASDLLVRQGGDEFVALLTGVKDADEATAAAERFRDALGRPYVIGEDRFDLTASIGVALARSDALDAEALLRNADIALYAAKAGGRNRVETFDSDLAAAVGREQSQRRLLREILEDDRLVMHFQPILDAASETAVGYEALARCVDDNGDLVGPSAFMDVITPTGLLWDLDRAAFALSCRAAAELGRLSPGSPPVVACNFSAISLVQADLVDVVMETASEAGIQPSQICIEITENAALKAGESTLCGLRALRANGFALALDDFGTGYSSLAHLRDLPLTAVKVDRSFVAELTARSAERAIARAIVDLATVLGLDVIAEGVETAEQLEQARGLGFSAVQGWYYSQALPLDEIIDRWLPEPAPESA
ncbi:MAG: EAL domain-containing protein [Ilumatobacter sp.]|uniref:putative bifunctional diguanylate cyclase/phosphodiesterase n=1 Tax=Ilumatobacter sp. TaxID=1967498 RepID=UPI002629D15D|nr:EAL domain-containing protein [Ilumatobacter sp.]MDJ0769606.1 EAL domain-containing protein [Ilumatobacter sp.]